MTFQELDVTTTRATALALSTALACVLLAACQRKVEPVPQPTAEPAPAPASTAPPATPTTTVAEEEPPAGVLRAYVWDCGGTKIRGRNLWRESAMAIDLHDGTHKLNSVPAASGAKYSDGSVTLSTKGGSAVLETSGNPPTQCNEIRAESLLEDARIRGVLYTGRGNEPGWNLEVGPGSRLLWVTNYGQERHELANATVSGDAAAGFVYSATESGGELRATIRKLACRDDMSGEAFDHQVVVAFGGREFRGCGARAQP